MKENIFRAYDIRGKYPDEIDEEVFYTLGRSYGSYLKEKYHQDKCDIIFLIGKLRWAKCLTWE